MFLLKRVLIENRIVRFPSFWCFYQIKINWIPDDHWFFSHICAWIMIAPLQLSRPLSWNLVSQVLLMVGVSGPGRTSQLAPDLDRSSASGSLSQKMMNLPGRWELPNFVIFLQCCPPHKQLVQVASYKKHGCVQTRSITSELGMIYKK